MAEAARGRRDNFVQHEVLGSGPGCKSRSGEGVTAADSLVLARRELTAREQMHERTRRAAHPGD